MLTYNTSFAFYHNNVKTKKPLTSVTLAYFLKLIKFSNPDLRNVFLKLKEATTPAQTAELKQHLYYVTPCVVTDNEGRAYSNIKSFTGILTLDFDKIGDTAQDFKHYLFDTYPFIFAAWLSSSGQGVRAMVHIPQVSTVEDFKDYYHGIADTLSIYKGFDMAPQNCVLPLFISYDPGILVRAIGEQWTTKKNRVPILPKIEPIRYRNDAKYYNWSVHNFNEAIIKIVDNGHPQVRAAAFALGGRVGAGYITFDDAITIACSAIALNKYLSKGTKGYQKTAKEMIQQGINYPLYF